MVGTMLFVLLLSQNNSSRVADPHQPAEDQNLARKSLKPRAQKTQGNQGSNLENGYKWWANSDSDWIRKSKKTQKKNEPREKRAVAKSVALFGVPFDTPVLNTGFLCSEKHCFSRGPI